VDCVHEVVPEGQIDIWVYRDLMKFGPNLDVSRLGWTCLQAIQESSAINKEYYRKWPEGTGLADSVLVPRGIHLHGEEATAESSPLLFSNVPDTFHQLMVVTRAPGSKARHQNLPNESTNRSSRTRS
jgi:hypothetical protein